MITVHVIRVFDSGERQSIEVPVGSTVGEVASKIGAPSGCVYTIMRQRVEASHVVGNGDQIFMNKTKFDAGC